MVILGVGSLMIGASSCSHIAAIPDADGEICADFNVPYPLHFLRSEAEQSSSSSRSAD
jgi:hypothetical protein